MSPKDDPEMAPEAPPSEAELAAAAALRRALERGRPDAPGDAEWQLVEAIRAAADPAPLSEEGQRRILDDAFAKRPGGRVIYYAFGGVATLAAMAAGFALFLKAVSPETSAPIGAAVAAPMALSRSTADLFPDGIPAKGGTSGRVDRIASARARDLRENRFNRWGVR